MRWCIKPKPSENKLNRLKNELNVDGLVATLLLQRGIETFDDAKRFFRPELSDLHDPFLMKDMQKAVNRVEKALADNENIMVFGDYDVDGTTAVSLMASYLRTLTTNVITYIPDRYDEGYGISYKGIDFASDNDFSLIIALDCGIKSVEHIEYAKQRNIDFIICDHHNPGDVVPDAVAVLDPKQADCFYPYKELCGCGVGFKLIQALGTNRNQTADDLMPYLDLVATAIAADIVPITGENRVLAHFGMKVINESPRPGLFALTQHISKQKYDITDVVFVFAPRINAAGRIKHGNEAVALLSEFDFEQAQQFAAEIETHNTNRKEFDRNITLEALQQIEANNEQNNYTTVVYDPSWHKGVIGIVASRLTETYYRPTLVFTQSGDKLAASARSVKGFDIYEALEQCATYLIQFGGHKYAAGMTLKPENYTLFKQAFEEVVRKTIDPNLLQPEISIDAEINFSDITPKLLRIINQFEPFGPQNMKPVFMTRNVRDTTFGKTIGEGDKHLKLFVKQNTDTGYPAIGFGLGNKFNLTTNYKPFAMAYTIEDNEWNGKATTQLMIKDIG